MTPFRFDEFGAIVKHLLEVPSERPATGQSSALSHLDFGIDGLQFATGVFDFHLPVDAALGLVDVFGPGCDRCLQGAQVADAMTADALASQGTELVLGYIQPTAVVGCVAELDPPDQFSRPGW